LWKRYAQFPYLPRLASVSVLKHAIDSGAANTNWEAETFAVADAFDAGVWKGLRYAQQGQPTPSTLVVHPDVAKIQIANTQPAGGEGGSPVGGESDGSGGGSDGGTGGAGGPKPGPVAAKPTKFFATFELDRVRAIKGLDAILREVVDHLVQSPNGIVELTLDIEASSSGFPDSTIRTVRENAAQLGADSHEFEA